MGFKRVSLIDLRVLPRLAGAKGRLMRTLEAALVLLALLTSTGGAWAAEAYPARPIRMIDPYAPGGSTEAQARIIAEKLNQAWGQPVVIDGRPGAGSAIGTQMVAKASPDGYTLLFTNLAFATIPNLHKKPPFNPVKDFAPVIRVGTQPLILVAHPSLPPTLRELLAYAKSHPGKLNFGSAGTGGASHLAMEYFKSVAGIDIVHVPYKGSAPASVAILGGEIQLATFSANSVMPHIKAGKLRALGVTTPKRSLLLPDVPSLAEAGVPGYEVTQWSGILAPHGTPQHIIVQLNQQINRGLTQTDARERLARIGVEPAGGGVQEFSAFVAAEVRKWGKVIREAGIQQE
jgi:tripartite-type tricarboxylate transporter receptor subunit TctC